MLGLCFGAYELLGVFQGCFQYNEHPLPYQSHTHLNSGETREENEEKSREQPEEKSSDSSEKTENFDEENLELSKSGPCSCTSTIEDLFDDDTRAILRNTKKLTERKRFILEKPINKFTVSTSLMSLNRDESILFNYIDDLTSNNRFQKFKSEDEIAETSFEGRISSKHCNDYRRNKRSSGDSTYYRKHNEQNGNSSSMNVDMNEAKVFFISAAT